MGWTREALWLEFFFLQSIHTGSEVRPVLYSQSNGGFVQMGKAAAASS